MRHVSSARGFTLLEMAVTAGLVMVVLAVSTPSVLSFIQSSRSDGAEGTIMNAFRVARERAVAERRNFEVRFIPPNQIQLARIEVPGPAKTVVSDMFLENGFEFVRPSGLPDTPDAFGGTGAINFGPSLTRMFTSEGTFTDNAGDPLNGTLFVADARGKVSARAVTILGATALLHGWRWDGAHWVD
jgi:type II secretory pathway pseudopilin PulG